MTTPITAAAAFAETVCDAAPLIASALADRPPVSTLAFSYAPDAVIVAGSITELDQAGPWLISAFANAGWDVVSHVGLDRWAERTAITFRPPWALEHPTAA